MLIISFTNNAFNFTYEKSIPPREIHMEIPLDQGGTVKLNLGIRNIEVLNKREENAKQKNRQSAKISEITEEEEDEAEKPKEEESAAPKNISIENDSDEKVANGSSTISNYPWAGIGALGTASALIAGIAYKKRQSIKQSLNDKVDQMYDYAIENIICPIYIKWEMLKCDGLSKSDIIKVISAIALLYGLKKANDAFGLLKYGKNAYQRIG